VFSRALEVAGINGNGGGLTSGDPVYTNPAERSKDYSLAPNHVAHDFRSFGTFELPIGPNKMLLGNSMGALARIVERWQTSFIVNASTGQPASVVASNMLYGNGVADIVYPFSTDQGKVSWNGQFGSYFGTGVLGKIPDPQCALVGSQLTTSCSLQAVTDAKTGQILFQNPTPGSRGNVGRQTISLPGLWTFDAAISKSVHIKESVIFQVRLDSTNILNHPGISSPTLDINNTDAFGLITSKDASHREFRGTMRLTF
jgi:hypothetical protein